VNPPNSAQLGGIPYHSSKLHPGPGNSVGMRPRTDTQTRVTTIHFASSIRLTRNVTSYRHSVTTKRTEDTIHGGSWVLPKPMMLALSYSQKGSGSLSPGRRFPSRRRDSQKIFDIGLLSMCFSNTTRTNCLQQNRSIYLLTRDECHQISAVSTFHQNMVSVIQHLPSGRRSLRQHSKAVH